MPVPVNLIIFAIRGAFRLGRATSLELQAHIRNGEVALPSVLATQQDPMDRVLSALLDHTLTPAQEQKRLALELELRGLSVNNPGIPAKHEEIIDFAREVGALEVAEAGEEEQGLVIIKQWSDAAKKEQVKPFVRIGLALVEIALDYASTNPGVFGVGSNGERFVKALATAIDEILPNSDDPDSAFKAEQIFGERAIAILAHNGLSALQGHITETVDQEHLRDISVSVLGPLIDNFKDGKIERKTLIEFRELLLGPMAREAISSVARHQKRFLGRRFGNNKALGAVTNAILVTIASEKDAGGKAIWSLDRSLDREVWTRVYGSLLDVAIKRPELFTGDADGAGSLFAQDLVKTVAARLQEMRDGKIDESVAALVVSDAIEVLSRNTAFLFDRETDAAGEKRPWNAVSHEALSNVLGSVAAGLRVAVADDGKVQADEVFKQVFSEEQLGELLRVVLDQAAKTPGMIAGDESRDEVKALIAGIARAVSDSNRNLLSSEDWLEVAAIVAEEAAKNPGRLFKITDGGAAVKPEEEFAVRVIGNLLGAAAKDFRARGRQKGSVLFGETLKIVIVETIETTADNAALFLGNEALLIELVNKINEIQKKEPQSFGRKEWLRIFRGALKKVSLSSDPKKELTKLKALKDLDGLRAYAEI